jgi:ketosteroid isomerase-like protein
MTAEEIATVFARRDEGFARYDAAALVADCADECVLESPITGALKGRAAIEKLYKNLLQHSRIFALSPRIS